MENFCKLKELYQFIQLIELDIQKNHNLSVNECMTICSINKGVVSAGNLSEQLALSKSRLSKVLSGLEKKDFISRRFAKEDKRVTQFSLTKKGVEKAKEVESSPVTIPDFSINYPGLNL